MSLASTCRSPALPSLPILLGWPPLLFPVHIVFLEMIIDPACSIVFEAEPAEEDMPTRPPRDPRRRLFGRAMLLRSAAQGAGALAAVIAVAIYSRLAGWPDDTLRALAFATLVLTNIGLILANRSSERPLLATLARPNRWLWGAVSIALGALLLALYVPVVAGLFHFARPDVAELAISLLAALTALCWFELLKRIVPPA